MIYKVSVINIIILFFLYINIIMINSLKIIYDRVVNQSWPIGALYVVSTPIGNLGDISVRAVHVLSTVDVIAVEDTRVSHTLLNILSINKPLMIANKHKESQIANKICQLLSNGKKIALISDSGSPAISDPGSLIVKIVRFSGYKVIPIPGASSVIAALMASGVMNPQDPKYMFAGFIPSKRSIRIKWLEKFKNIDFPVIMFETVHRLIASINDFLFVYGQIRLITLAKELTKLHEEIITYNIIDMNNWIKNFRESINGEFILILHPNKNIESEAYITEEKIDEALMNLLKKQSLRDSVNIITKLTGIKHSYIYSRALIQSKQID